MKPNHLLDAASGVLITASFAGWLPPIAAVLGIVWYVIQISESETGKRVWAWVTRRRPDAPSP